MNTLLRSIVTGGVLLAAAACGAASGSDESSLRTASLRAGPFDPTPDTTEGLVNVSTDLSRLLEGNALKDACARYFAGAHDRRSKLLCGKAMFFDEGFGTAGVPAPIVKFLANELPDELGVGFSKLGLIPDPRSPDHIPLGLAPGAKMANVDTFAFTCASCHFARLPDGRYAVGAPNHDYEYGKHNLALGVFPLVAALGGLSGAQDADAMAIIQPLLDRVNRNWLLKARLYAALAPIAISGAKIPSFPAEAQHHYAHWKPGTMDFFIAPLPFDDQVHTISKISALWGIPTNEEAHAAGMETALLGHTGGTSSLAHFAHSFVDLGGGDVSQWPAERLEPLVAFLESLRAPENPTPPEPAAVRRGEALFESKGCLGCHGGPRGSGTRVYTFDEIGTDRALERWADPTLSGRPCCGLRFPPPDRITHGIKAPRLVGQWALRRLLHNGSVDSLEALFCLGGPRGRITAPAYGDGGHAFTCEGLTASDKRDLIAFLEAH